MPDRRRALTAMLPLRIEVNGRPFEHAVEPRRTLADFLREDLGLKGTHLFASTASAGTATSSWTARPCARA